MAKERWGSQLGVILAVAGSAVGLGNFLRFPVQAARHGGGAFIIPYLTALVLLGLPLVWVEWTLGRYGGGLGRSTAPGIFHAMANGNRFAKYVGVLGVFGPLVIYIYYVYIESWLLGYGVFALAGSYNSCTTRESMESFLRGYQGLEANRYFSSLWPAFIFFLITFLLNVLIVYRGISKGIERVCKWGMPILFALAIILVVRLLTLGTPDPARPDNNVANGLGYLWNPDWSKLADARVWLAAAGQIFFTLSVGIGVIMTYASYLGKKDDVPLSGLTAAATNEFAEVVLGGSIVIPAAVIFLGGTAVADIAGAGGFNLGFVTMPFVLQKMAGGNIFGFLWFSLLFLAGITSSISLAQPVIAFLEDEFKMTRKAAVTIFGAVSFVLCCACISLFGRGVLDELDFWGGTFCLVLFATAQIILFAWVFGMDRGWRELHAGAAITVPRVYRRIIRYVTPAMLLVILGFWLVQEGVPALTLKTVEESNVPYVIGTRIALLLLFGFLCSLVRAARRDRPAEPIMAETEGVEP